MTADIFLVFGLGFFLFVCWLIVSTQRLEQARLDRQHDVAYERQLNERREFGYKRVEKSQRYRIRHKVK